MLDLTTLAEKAGYLFPPRARAWLLGVAIAVILWFLWRDFRPAVVMADTRRNIIALTARVDTLSARLDDQVAQNGVTLDEIRAMQRWMCYQNRVDAVLAGIPCETITRGGVP